MEYLCTYIIYFFIYSVFGWVCETIYCSIGSRKLVNRGFLNGPICPIYGFGALFIILMLKDYYENLFMLFIYAIIVTSILEYFASIGLEKMFHAKWWDYNHKFCNLHGRICLKNSILFGLMGVFLIKIIHPMIRHLVCMIPSNIVYYLSVVLTIWIIIELVVTINSINKLGKKLEGLGKLKTELEKIDVKLDKLDSEELKIAINDLNHSENNIKLNLEDVINKISNIKSNNKIQKRIINAFPNMKHKKYHDQLQHLKEIFKEKSK